MSMFEKAYKGGVMAGLVLLKGATYWKSLRNAVLDCNVRFYEFPYM